MEFHLEVHLSIEEVGMLSRGHFKARNRSEVVKVAYQFIQNIKRETGYRRTVIEQVMVNGTADLTEQVKQMENQKLPPMDDVFW
jgi:hypothetical protein